jgi:phosphate:Na+ symporter
MHYIQKEKIKTQRILAFAIFFIGFSMFFTNNAFASFKIIASTWPHALMGASAGVVFLMMGLGNMTASFKALAGDELREVLSTLTNTRLKALATGIGVTGIVQSSAATTAMVVGFISSKLMTLPQALGVILGADIGTTITVQLIAFKLNQYALVFVILGYMTKSFSKKESIWHLGNIVAAIGAIFFGIFMIAESMSILNDFKPVQEVLKHISSPVIGVALGFIITALMQSSAASIAIMIALASQGLLSVEGAIYLVIGANVGTCITAVLISLGSDQNGKRAAAAHVFFKTTAMITTVIAMYFAGNWIIDKVLMLDFTHSATVHMVAPRQIAHMHMIFNILIAITFLPFTYFIANILEKVIPAKRQKVRVQTKHLQPFLINIPSLALDAARQECAHMAELVDVHLQKSFSQITDGGIDELSKLKSRERDIDALYKQILLYLSQLSSNKLTEHETHTLVWLMNILNRTENIADLMGQDMYDIGRRRRRRDIHISTQTLTQLRKLSEAVHQSFLYSITPLQNVKTKTSNRVKVMNKKLFDALTAETITLLNKRLRSNDANRTATYSLEMDMVERYQRVFSNTRKIVKDTMDMNKNINPK